MATLIDTSVPTKHPRKSMEVEFELDGVESVPSFSLQAGTHAQGARLGSPFRTNRMSHLCIKHTDPSRRHQSFVINYESMCAIASENKPFSCIPWDVWKQNHANWPPHRPLVVCKICRSSCVCDGRRYLPGTMDPFVRFHIWRPSLRRVCDSSCSTDARDLATVL